MKKFENFEAITAPLPIINIDTDMIIPKQFLKTVKRTGLGANLFDEMRFDKNGNEIADFILNKEPYRNAGIIVAGENFGCGSSREHAPWSLLDFGIKCIIAPSFADIFFNNCFKNGILPIKLSKDECEKINKVANSNNPLLKIDLQNQTISSNDNTISINFDVEPFRKKCLLEGLDDIGLTLEKKSKIDEFETNNKKEQPWLY